jgi:FkbM family methyltransferase
VPGTVQTWLKRIRRRVRALPLFARKRGKFQKELFGRCYWIPIVQQMKDPLKETQPELLSVIRRLYGRYRGAFIDVGVNVGQTLVKVLSIGGEIPYFGFEANLNAAFFVKQFLRVNEINNEYLIAPLALSNRVGPVTLYRKGLLGSGSSTTASYRKSHPSFKYRDPIIAIDGDLVVSTLGIERIAIVKVDVEGGELEVLEGLRATLTKHRPFVICEVQSIDRRDQNGEVAGMREQRQEELERLMRGMGYLPFRIGLDGSWEQVASLRIGQERGRDYLFVPNEELDNAPELFGVAGQRCSEEGPATGKERQPTR